MTRRQTPAAAPGRAVRGAQEAQDGCCVDCGDLLDERYDGKKRCLYCSISSQQLASRSVVVSTERGREWQKPRLLPEDEYRNINDA